MSAVRSMTGFGQAAAENDRFRVAVTLRAVNHRFLDLVFRLRDDLRAAETELRALLTERLQRGRVEVGVEVTALGGRPVAVAVDTAVAEELHRAGAALAERGLVTGGLAIGDFLRLPEVLRVETRDPEWREEDRELLRRTVAAAAADLVAAREGEGAHLAAAIRERVAGLRAVERALREHAAGQPAALAAALRQRLATLLAGEVDEARLAQEVAVLADRGDVSEELDRLRAHLDGVDATLGGDEAAVGKRLDFLIQELVRELNTVGSKCRDAGMTALVVDGKVLCEQMREQAQNVE